MCRRLGIKENNLYFLVGGVRCVLKGTPVVLATVFPVTAQQARVVQLIHNSLYYNGLTPLSGEPGQRLFVLRT